MHCFHLGDMVQSNLFQAHRDPQAQIHLETGVSVNI